MKLFHTILVPHDLSRHANRAVKLASELAGPRGKLIVLHVVNNYENEPFQKRVLARGRRQLERVLRAARRGRGGPSVEQRVEAGHPHRRIIAAARGIDSIVMCTAGRTGLAHLVIGSVAEHVVRLAPVPVLTFRPLRARMAPRRRAQAA